MWDGHYYVLIQLNVGRFAPIHLTLKDLGIGRFWQKHTNSPDASLSLDTHIGGSRVGGSHLKFCPRQPISSVVSLGYELNLVSGLITQKCTVPYVGSVKSSQLKPTAKPRGIAWGLLSNQYHPKPS